MSGKRFSVEQCLELVEQSPVAVSVHDKIAWLALFARDFVVEDPVGSAPHRGGENGREVLAQFYTTFIAANDISFLVDRDIVCALHVVRDLTMEIAMSDEVVVRVPMHLLYELAEEEGALKIRRLAAHWELQPMLQQQMSLSWPHLKVGAVSGWRMLRHLGLMGTAGFMRARSSVGDAGKQCVESFAAGFNRAGPSDLASLFDSRETPIDFPYAGQRLTIEECANQGGTLRFDKTLAAGDIVSATFEYTVEATRRQGVAFFQLDRASLKILKLSFYW